MQNEKDVLSLLADGRFHSGEELGAVLGVTRSAVWKKIKQIEGRYNLPVQAVRGRGYSVAERFELLNVADIERYMSQEALHLRKHIELKQSIYSTHDFLLNEQAHLLKTGTVCLAEHQSAGRGRRGRKWVSPFGANIYLSLCWRFELAPTQLMGLSLSLATFVAKALRHYGITHGLSLKWPNDIYWNGQKLGGILVDIIGEANDSCTVVASLGLNVRLPGHAIDEIDQPVTDIRQIVGQPVSRNQLVGLLLDQIFIGMHTFSKQGFAPFRSDWAALDLTKGKQVTLQTNTSAISGVAKGVTERGEVLLETAEGLKAYQSGDISLRVN